MAVVPHQFGRFRLGNCQFSFPNDRPAGTYITDGFVAGHPGDAWRNTLPDGCLAALSDALHEALQLISVQVSA